jgi:hypothetical protein
MSESTPDVPRPNTVGKPNRTSSEIRRDIEQQRLDFGSSVEALRGRVTEITDWRRQVREHRRELIIGAAATGFLIGGMMALRRRR